LAAGLSEDADTVIELRYPPTAGRPESNTVVVDLRTLVTQGGDYSLPDGAVVNVRQRPRQTVSVIGLVHKPGPVEIPPGRPLTLLEAVSAAGGRSLQIADRVKVIRQAPNLREPLIISASFKRAKQQQGSADNLPLMAGDIVSLEETAATFTIDTLRSFLRFGFSSAIPGF
jgi:protein involved in polysaccharide export with SLBB domain